MFFCNQHPVIATCHGTTRCPELKQCELVFLRTAKPVRLRIPIDLSGGKREMIENEKHEEQRSGAGEALLVLITTALWIALM